MITRPPCLFFAVKEKKKKNLFLYQLCLFEMDSSVPATELKTIKKNRGVIDTRIIKLKEGGDMGGVVVGKEEGRDQKIIYHKKKIFKKKK